MSSQSIERKVNDLTRRMQEAALAEDFELAARLRNEIEGLKSANVRKPPPGQMGLGTHVPVAEPPKGWKPPKKPDPMTTNVKRGR
jgi:hypothetical protein